MDLGSPLLLGSSDRRLRRRAATDIPFKTLCFLNLSTIEGWETPHTTTDDHALFSECEPRRDSTGIFLLMELLTALRPDKYLSLRAHPPHCRLHHDKRETWAWGCLFLKKGECRNTPATHVASPYKPKRHPLVQGETQTLMLVITLN